MATATEQIKDIFSNRVKWFFDNLNLETLPSPKLSFIFHSPDQSRSSEVIQGFLTDYLAQIQQANSNEAGLYVGLAYKMKEFLNKSNFNDFDLIKNSIIRHSIDMIFKPDKVLERQNENLLNIEKLYILKQYINHRNYQLIFIDGIDFAALIDEIDNILKTQKQMSSIPKYISDLLDLNKGPKENIIELLTDRLFDHSDKSVKIILFSSESFEDPSMKGFMFPEATKMHRLREISVSSVNEMPHLFYNNQYRASYVPMKKNQFEIKKWSLIRN
ncbi:MAG: hypothetical protein INQ03_15810 [Candidatus Heimdallarchaeota archaeon]|nr:hypothetical protein [Candidatus Heimdallarchaeota archaeon]